MILNTRATLFLLVSTLPFAAMPARAQSGVDATARRIATVSTIAAEEYALGVVGGEVVSAAELEEARLFLVEARRLAEQLPAAVRQTVVSQLDGLLATVERRGDVAVLSAGTDSLRTLLAAGLGIHLDPLPTDPLALARGARVYASACASCHGVAGGGDGEAGRGLEPPPARFTDRAGLRTTSPLDFFRKVSVGVAGTAMAGFESALTLEDRWAVSVYVAGLRYTDAERAEGRRWLAARCPACLAALSDGNVFLTVTDDTLAARLVARAGRAIPEAAVAFARTAGAREVLGADRRLAVRRVVAQVEEGIASAVVLARAGSRADAISASLDAYLAFEAIEREVGARSAGAATRVERAFGALRVALADGDVAEVLAAQAAARESLAGAAAVMEDSGSTAALFGQSLLIILREGLEAILIIGALAAVLTQAGARNRIRDLGIGAGMAVIVSVVVAVLLVNVLRLTLPQQEALEGMTMLLASVVLFGVASWMVSKVEAERWQAFVRAQMRGALSSGRALALAGVAFLAVFREGVETILFYAALLGTAKSAQGVMAVWVGLAAGGAVLALIYVGMQRWGVRIPIRPFFAVTGVLLTVMAVSFTGQGVAELQAAGWVPATPLRLPTLPVLGVFPTVQTVFAQAALGLAFAIALWWVFRRPRAAPARG
ncbi:MAG: FTR1 family protein [Gemmatimonadota bacterium]|nr:FTR1 family protein [Gemmatimonadota bacterium]